LNQEKDLSKESENKNKSQPRQTAVKIKIKDLISGKYVVQEGWEPNYVLSKGKKVSRVNIIGVIVQKSTSQVLNYDFLTMDDSSGKITLRAFENSQILDQFQVGDILNIIGRPREYANEIYVVPEIGKKINDNRWIEVRKLELGTETEEEINENNSDTKEEVIEIEDIDNDNDKIIKIIKELDDGSGVDYEEITKRMQNVDSEKIIKNLLLQGDIFEVKPGRLKILE